MRRSILSLAFFGLVGLTLTAADAKACHKRKACPTPCATTVVYEPAPICEPTPVCEPAPCAPRKKCGLLGGGLGHGGLFKGGLCGKRKAACAPAPVCETVVYAAPAPVYYTTPSAQTVVPSGQGLTVPSKQIN